jgi:hypothetical protein
MGRTATALLVLIAVGGCVADNQGPAAFQSAQKGPSPATASCYATWSKPDQFAVLHDDTVVPVPPTTSVAPTAPTAISPPVAHTAVAAAPKALATPKPLPPLLPGEALPPLGGATSATTVASNDLAIDPELARATMVQTPVDHPETEAHPTKVQTASYQAKKTASEGELALANAAGPAIRMVNTKRVTLNYELKDVGVSGVSGVELWCTQDAHTWKRGEIVAQTNHSFSVEVKEEGLHGFTLLARNGSGAGKDSPAVGEQPQVWVMVDYTKPTVQITSVEVAHGAKAPTVQVRWTAKDKNLGPRPITLSYAEQPEGPWTTIVAGVENSGQYEWQAPAGAPHHVFLRVEAADMPGNVGAAQTANALRLDAVVTAAVPAVGVIRKPVPALPALDASRPSAAILGVETNGN